MFDIQCHICDRRYLVGSRSIESFENTPAGPVAHARCPRGHTVVRSFWPQARTVRHDAQVVAAA